MNVIDAFRAFEGSGLSTFMRESEWAFPLAESIHVVSVMLMVGAIAMLDLRLLGLASRRQPVIQVSAEALPWTWASFVIAVLSGLALFATQPAQYLVNLQFQLKMLLILLAGANLGIFHRLTWRRVRQWNESAPTPGPARIAAGLSLSLWAGVVIFGRWIGWTLLG